MSARDLDIIFPMYTIVSGWNFIVSVKIVKYIIYTINNDLIVIGHMKVCMKMKDDSKTHFGNNLLKKLWKCLYSGQCAKQMLFSQLLYMCI